MATFNFTIEDGDDRHNLSGTYTARTIEDIVYAINRVTGEDNGVPETEYAELPALSPNVEELPQKNLRLLFTALEEGEQVVLDYTDEEGDRTQRVIHLDADGAVVQDDRVIAICTLRQNFRTFIFSRINAVGLIGSKKLVRVVA